MIEDVIPGASGPQSMIEQDRPHELIDELAGITPKLFADIAPDHEEQQKMVQKFMDCEEFAVIAFWDLDPEQDVFSCTRHFYVPNPKKRMTRDVNGTQLYEILYLSKHGRNRDKEIFFFFEGPLVEVDQDLNEVDAT